MLRAFLGFLALILCTLTTTGIAQEFRVHTRVWDLGVSTQPVSYSLTLWHAGKIYDVIHSAGEVTILEPAQRRCWVMNSDKNLLTSVDFDELKHLLRGAEERLSLRVRELDAKSNTSKDLVESLRSQLHPQFVTQFDASQHRLSLDSKLLSYRVRGQSQVPPEAIEAFLNYADWACRLNFVLHPQPVFPSARLELNQQLRKLRLFPIEVALRTQLDQPLNLRAEHELAWNLDARDRASIHLWESQLRDSKLQKVSLAEYRRAALSPQLAKTR